MSPEWRVRLRRGAALLLVLPLVAALVSVTRRARLERADFVLDNGSELETLDPAAIKGQADGRVAAALFEGLTVKHPETLEALPGAAESWERSPDGLTWTFRLREASWSNGEPLTAADFLWSWRRLLDPATAAPNAYQLWCVRGARAFSGSAAEEREEAWAQVGLRAPDARTLVVELERPTPWFLALTSFHALFPVHRPSLEAFRARFPARWESEWIRPENLVTNGPYVLSLRRVNDRLRLTRNPRYWDTASVAFDTVDVLACEQAGTSLNLYLAGEVDWLDRVPTALVPRLLEREDFTPAPYLATYFYRVNVTRPPFDDRRVRRALALAIDRRAICERILRKGERPCWSLTPLGLRGYARPEMRHADPGTTPAEHAAALERDAEEARGLLEAAGYGPGNPLPPFEILFNTSETHRDVAEVVAAGWARMLGVEARLLNQERKSYFDSQQTLRYDVSRSSWIGDYPDPNTFLEVFVGGGDNNRTGWADERYDALVAAAAREGDAARRMELLAEAEALLLEELPILPIYGYVSQNLVNPRLGGFHANVLDEHPPKFWHWRTDAELEAWREEHGAGRERVEAPGR